MKNAKLRQVFSWLDSVIFVLVIGRLALVIFSSAFNDYMTRTKVTEGLGLAASAKSAVIENAENGAAFNAGWIAPNATSNVSSKTVPTEAARKTNVYTGVAINPTNGVITITYTDKVDKDSPFILLIPVVDKTFLAPGNPPVSGSINWECHSANVPAI